MAYDWWFPHSGDGKPSGGAPAGMSGFHKMTVNMSSVPSKDTFPLTPPWKDTCSRKETFLHMTESWLESACPEGSQAVWTLADSTTALQMWCGTESLFNQDCQNSTKGLGDPPSLLTPRQSRCRKLSSKGRRHQSGSEDVPQSHGCEQSGGTLQSGPRAPSLQEPQLAPREQLLSESWCQAKRNAVED